MEFIAFILFLFIPVASTIVFIIYIRIYNNVDSPPIPSKSNSNESNGVNKQTNKADSENGRESNKKNKVDEHYYTADLNLPKELRTSIQQYLIFFKEFVLTTKEISLDFEVKTLKNGLQCRTRITSEFRKEDLEIWFEEYIGFFKNKVTDKKMSPINVEGNQLASQIDILKLKLENEIAHLQNSLEIARVENKLLLKDNEFLKKLSLKIAEKDITINHQLIQGGEQQFADKIQNK